MEVDPADGAVVLLELLEESAHSVVKNLDGAVVEGGCDPWTLGVESKALDTVALGLEFYEEGVVLSHGRVGHEGRRRRDERWEVRRVTARGAGAFGGALVGGRGGVWGGGGGGGGGRRRRPRPPGGNAWGCNLLHDWYNSYCKQEQQQPPPPPPPFMFASADDWFAYLCIVCR